MHSKAPLSRSWGFAQCSPVPLPGNSFPSDSPTRQFSVPTEIFRFVYCHLLFNYQCSLLSRDSLFRLSHLLCFVNNFFEVFHFLHLRFSRALVYNTTQAFCLSICFLFLLFTFPVIVHIKQHISVLAPIKIPRKCFLGIFNAEGGIRTHVPFRTNGFQDRLVMTTSIPLQS